jgi:hypothetical protein
MPPANHCWRQQRRAVANDSWNARYSTLKREIHDSRINDRADPQIASPSPLCRRSNSPLRQGPPLSICGRAGMRPCRSSIEFHLYGTGWRSDQLPSARNDPQRWRDRAKKMRELARTMADQKAAILMDDLAADYDKLAERADVRTDGKPPSNGKSR